jgi:hypothetical protein
VNPMSTNAITAGPSIEYEQVGGHRNLPCRRLWVREDGHEPDLETVRCGRRWERTPSGASIREATLRAFFPGRRLKQAAKARPAARARYRSDESSRSRRGWCYLDHRQHRFRLSADPAALEHRRLFAREVARWLDPGATRVCRIGEAGPASRFYGGYPRPSRHVSRVQTDGPREIEGLRLRDRRGGIGLTPAAPWELTTYSASAGGRS